MRQGKQAEPFCDSGLFSQIDFSGGALVAISGGSDSTALLLLVRRHLARAAPSARLLAVTVDHRLRPDSAEEAHAVASLCAAHGIAHRIVAWSGEKPATGLPAAAREARYHLLAQAAGEAGLGMILTGHTADDQAETVLMRLARNGDARSGRGLAGMAPVTLYDGRVWIVRPLLGTSRAALRTFLRDQGIGWIEDPTNSDSRFERPRIRMQIGEEQSAGTDEALAMAKAAAARRLDLGRRAAGLIRNHAALVSPGLLRLAPDFLAPEDRHGAAYGLQLMLAAVGGIPFLPEREQIEELLSGLKAGGKGRPLRRTLARCVMDARRAGVFLHREWRDLPEPAPVSNGTLWDGRRRITFGDTDAALVIGPAGDEVARGIIADDGNAPPTSLRRAALAAEPALWRNGSFAGLSGGRAAPGTFLAVPVAANWARFLPSFDIEPARAIAGLLETGPLSPPPLIGHNDAATSLATRPKA